MLLGTHTSKRTLLRLRGSREKRHDFTQTTIIRATASVSDMLQDLGWSSLELRRTTTRLNLLYKMNRDQIDLDVNSYLQAHSEVRTRRSHRYRYRQDKATKNIYFYSFFPRTIRLWNKLSAEIVESDSLAVFNSKLLPYLAKNY